MSKAILEQVGLSKGESEVYLILLKIGEATASEIAKHTKIARPNVYDYLNKLKYKGMVIFVSKKNKVHYIPSSPKKILEYLDEKREIIEQEIPSLLNMYHPEKEKPRVELYEGADGLKTLMNDIIKTGKDLVGWGASDRVKEILPEYFIKRYLKQREKKKIKAKQLFVKTQGVLESSMSQFKGIPKEFSSPSTTIIYGNNVAIIIYTTMPLVIIIKSKELSESYKKHFEILWKNSKK